MRFFGRALLCALILLSAPAMADDLSNGSWSTTDASNTAAPPNGWPAGMFPNQVEPAARSIMGGVRRWWERANPNLSTTGSAGAYVLTPSNTSYPTAYTQGEVYCAKANFASVGNDTLNVNSLGAKPIYSLSGSNTIAKIPANAILSGAMFCAGYDSALNSGAGGFQLLSTVLPSGFGSAAFQSTSTFLQTSNNLSDVPNKGTARSNLGLSNGATTTVTVSTSGPSGGSSGDLWIVY